MSLSLYLERAKDKYASGEKNAIRHFMWQVSIAHLVSQQAAVGFGDAHEKGEWQKEQSKEDAKRGPCFNNPKCDTTADVYNNSVARLWAKTIQRNWMRGRRIVRYGRRRG